MMLKICWCPTLAQLTRPASGHSELLEGSGRQLRMISNICSFQSVFCASPSVIVYIFRFCFASWVGCLGHAVWPTETKWCLQPGGQTANATAETPVKAAAKLFGSVTSAWESAGRSRHKTVHFQSWVCLMTFSSFSMQLDICGYLTWNKNKPITTPWHFGQTQNCWR